MVPEVLDCGMMKNNTNSENMKTIDATPTWEAMVPVLIYIIRNSKTREGLKNVEPELLRMAQAADRWNAHCRETR